jgi:aspartate kinase
MEIKVFKFGGASVNGAKGVQNVAKIVRKYSSDNIIMVVSAMGKTTNALEAILEHYLAGDAVAMVDDYYKLKDFHFSIIHDLFPDSDHKVFDQLEKVFNELREYLKNGHLTKGRRKDYNFEYDQVVSFGERFATLIVNHFLVFAGISSKLFDAAKLIKTDSSYRNARVDWKTTTSKIRRALNGYFLKEEKNQKVAVIQGFTGSNNAGFITTLGREGSDYTAAIIAYSLKTKEVTIWKDVPGVMNGDPKWFKDAKKIDVLSYREAIELAFFGASIIHPKTIKPLENADITLRVKSFLNPGLTGTVIRNIARWKVPFPIFIRKQNQVLVSLSPRDFSFIIEENLSDIFAIFARHQIRVNMMQNSAISFSVCVDHDQALESICIKELQKDYLVRYNKDLELFTIRHYHQPAINKIIKGRKVLLEQKTRSTVHLILVKQPENRT